MSQTEHQQIQAVRRRQLGLITIGVVTAVLGPLSFLVSSELAPMLTVFGLAWFLVPVAYVMFTDAVAGAVVRLSPPEAPPQQSLRSLAFLTFVPWFGALVEIVLLHRLAKLTATLPGTTDRSRLVLTLAVLRPGASLVTIPLNLALSAVTPDGWMIGYAVSPLLSLAVLGVITQIVITPILDNLVPDVTATGLAAAGGTSSMAVSSSGTDREAR